MNLQTTYMGLELKSPLVPAASPLTGEFDKCRELEDAGASALVLPSLFEERVIRDSQELSHHMVYGTESFAEAMTYLPEMETDYLGPESSLELIRILKESLEIPIIASLNGVTTGGWIDYAKLMEEAGADGIELNVYFVATDLETSSAAVEEMYLSILSETKMTVKIPVAMKLSPYFTSVANMAHRLDEAGADALVLFNRFYQPTIDLDELEVRPDLELSTPFESRLPLRWIGILNGRINASLGATKGIHSHLEVLMMLMAGADVTMPASALLEKGTSHLGVMLKGMQEWMEEKEYESVAQMKGSMSQRSVADPAAFERANYLKTLHSWKG